MRTIKLHKIIAEIVLNAKNVLKPLVWLNLTSCDQDCAKFRIDRNVYVVYIFITLSV